MATADDVLVEVYRIVRDPARTATTEAVALKMLSHAQRAINTYSRSAVSTVVLPTVASTSLYAVPSGLARVDMVRDGTRDLPRMTLPQLWSRDKNWPSVIGTRFITWARLGRGIIGLIPSKAGASSVNLVGPTNLADLTAITDAISVRDDQLENLTELTEAIFTLRLRLFPAFNAVMARLAEKYSIAPTKIFAPGLKPTDSSERVAGVTPGDVPDTEEANQMLASQRPGAQPMRGGGGR
jgi:hypothetical protein